MQRRNEFRWRPGQEASLAIPCSDLRSFGSKCTALKKVLATLLGLFGGPSHSAPGALCPLAPPSYAPGPMAPHHCVALAIDRLKLLYKTFDPEPIIYLG